MQKRTQQAFTLIELLTVIAIIAILSAILFPVFAQVRENARAATSISNMKQISTALAQFQLDNRKYPDVLFGYVYQSNGQVIAMDKALAQAQADNLAGKPYSDPSIYFPGLYPEYIKDPNVFTDPNNQVKDLTKDTYHISGVNIPVNILAPCNANNDNILTGKTSPCTGATPGTLVTTARNFYIADAYDVSPQISGSNKIQDGLDIHAVYVPRFQASWTSIDPNLDCNGGATAAVAGLCNASGPGLPTRNDYLHQGRWKAPPSDTYLDCTTYHVPQTGVVLVLREDGTVKKVNVSKFQASGANGATDPDVSDISVNSSGVSAANFWKSPEN